MTESFITKISSGPKKEGKSLNLWSEIEVPKTKSLLSVLLSDGQKAIRSDGSSKLKSLSFK